MLCSRHPCAPARTYALGWEARADFLAPAVNPCTCCTWLQFVRPLTWAFASVPPLQAAATWTRVDVLQQCREACGGMGFLAANKIGPTITDTNVDVTFEGEHASARPPRSPAHLPVRFPF